MKKVILMAIVAMIAAVSCEKQDGAERGKVGNLSWELTENGTLTISGTGAMPDYNGLIGSADYDPAPWDTPRWPYTEESYIHKVIISEGVTNIGNWAFCGRPNLTEVTIPESVTRIGDNAFVNCTSLTGIIIPDGVTGIGKEAFRDCWKLASLTLPQGVKTIGECAFMDCAITDISIPAGMSSIEPGTFHGCRGMTAIVVPDNITTIGEGAFGGSNYTDITIGSGVTSIGIKAFTTQHDARATSVTVRASLPPQLGDDNNDAFTESEDAVLYVPKGSLEAYKTSPAWSREFKNIAEQQ